MAEIEIKKETRHDRKWEYEAEITDQGSRYVFHITLNWAEYNHWCKSGDEQPQRVVEALLRFLLEREPASAIMSRFDCAIVRRFFPEVDERLPRMI